MTEPMTEQRNLNIVQTIIEAYTKGSVPPPASEYLAEDIEWIVSGAYDDPIVGRYKGHKQVEQLFAVFNDTIEGDKYEVKEYIAQDNKIVVRGEEKVRFKATGRTVDCSFIYVITLNDGKIIEFHAMYGYP